MTGLRNATGGSAPPPDAEATVLEDVAYGDCGEVEEEGGEGVSGEGSGGLRGTD